MFKKLKKRKDHSSAQSQQSVPSLAESQSQSSSSQSRPSLAESYSSPSQSGPSLAEPQSGTSMPRPDRTEKLGLFVLREDTQSNARDSLVE